MSAASAASQEDTCKASRKDAEVSPANHGGDRSCHLEGKQHDCSHCNDGVQQIRRAHRRIATRKGVLHGSGRPISERRLLQEWLPSERRHCSLGLHGHPPTDVRFTRLIGRPQSAPEQDDAP
jgi:hypothetical protein